MPPPPPPPPLVDWTTVEVDTPYAVGRPSASPSIAPDAPSPPPNAIGPRTDGRRLSAAPGIIGGGAQRRPAGSRSATRPPTNAVRNVIIRNLCSRDASVDSVSGQMFSRCLDRTRRLASRLRRADRHQGWNVRHPVRGHDPGRQPCCTTPRRTDQAVLARLKTDLASTTPVRHAEWSRGRRV